MYMMMKLMMMMMMVVSSNCEVGVESEDNSGKDLISACAEGPDNVEEIVRILRNGANPNVATEDGESALHLACIWGGGDKIRVLLDAGADPNYRSSQKASSLDMTPLSWCAYAGYDDAVQEFIKDDRTNINLLVRKENGECMTPLDIAYIIGERGEKTRKLLQDANALRWSDIKDDDKMLRLLLPPSGCKS